MSKNIFLISLLIIFSFLIITISPTIILPFSYKNKKSSNNLNSFESQLDNTIYTTMKVYNQEIDFHITMERYPMYISDNIYKKFDSSDTNKKEPAKLYSLDQIGINSASLINKTITVKSNYSEKNEIKEINIFRTRKFLNVSEYVKNRMGYATEEAEIGFNIVRGSQYQYVEETENDIDTEKMMEDYQRDKDREKAYDELYGKNKTKETDNIKGYDPMNEYNPDYNDDDSDNKRPYNDEELEEIYENYTNTNKNNGNKNNNNNGNKIEFNNNVCIKDYSFSSFQCQKKSFNELYDEEHNEENYNNLEINNDNFNNHSKSIYFKLFVQSCSKDENYTNQNNDNDKTHLIFSSDNNKYQDFYFYCQRTEN